MGWGWGTVQATRPALSPAEIPVGAGVLPWHAGHPEASLTTLPRPCGSGGPASLQEENGTPSLPQTRHPDRSEWTPEMSG